MRMSCHGPGNVMLTDSDTTAPHGDAMATPCIGHDIAMALPWAVPWVVPWAVPWYHGITMGRDVFHTMPCNKVP